MSNFEVHFEPLQPDAAELGRCATLGWDARTFGFNVGSWQPESTGATPPPPHRLIEALQTWMMDRKVELISTQVPGDASSWFSTLGMVGFRFVDLTLLGYLRRLDRLPPSRLSLRLATAEDIPALERMAGSAFHFGRYHTDARFPRALADQRYREWIRRALTQTAPDEFVHVCGPQGAPAGFVHSQLRGQLADLRLAAVDPERGDGFVAPALFSGALGELARLGARSASARLSAANLPVLNLYASLGFVFREPFAVFHLHRSGSPHLLPP